VPGLDKINSHLFAAVNALIPIGELKNLKQYFNKFNYREATAYIEASGKELSHFYFKRDDPWAYFCYYRDLTWVDIPIFTREGLESFQILELIDFEQTRISQCINRRDFKTLFYILDKRIALLAYEKLFDSIPDEDKHEMFWFIYSRCGFALDDFPEEYIKKIQGYLLRPLDLPEGDTMEIFRGQSEPRTTPIHREHSWTLDINTAVRFAVQQEGQAKVYKALIDKKDVTAFIKRKNEKEIVVFPHRLRDIERIQLFSIADLKSQLNPQGIKERYQYYNRQLRKEYFYRPEGIHGIMHTRRVLLLNIIISLLQGCSEKQLNILCTAALYHDIGRINDNVDPQHGRESFRKTQHLGLLTGVDLSEGQILKFIIENHCIRDSQAREHLPNYGLGDGKERESQYLFDIFKDADGLDRVRINDLDSRQLRTVQGKKLIMVARQLYHNFDSFGLE
jgi:hypothetical protein